MSCVRVPVTVPSYCWVSICLLGLAGCGSSSAAPLKPPAIDAAAAARDALAEFDQDKDGALSPAELSKCASLKAAKSKADGDGNGKLTESELANRIARYSSTGVGLMPAPVTVMVNGAPLAGATVTFTPEKFLGGVLATAAGETDAQGIVRLKLPEAPAPGLPQGLYRVTISKLTGSKETLPARYNTASELGVEVAIDAEALMTGIRFDLTSQ